ncbi:DNA internalization-related competence protein ComEC/Rec2 [Bacillus spongiae]|uniref:DNA internalization-related competence protein ComEC/Rec2 n=1 Tax=Bacillus spongiae TaxID=2683610 RepID=A0ABU8H9A3_9BACI
MIFYVYITFSFVIGVSLQLTAGGGFMLLCFFLLVILFKKMPLTAVPLLIASFIIGYEYTEYIDANQISSYNGNETSFTIFVKEPLQQQDDNLRGIVYTTKERFLLTYSSPNVTEHSVNNLSFPIGSKCQVEGKLEKAKKPSNMNAFDYRQYLRNQQVYWTLEVHHAVCQKDGKSLSIFINQWRDRAKSFILSHFGQASPVALALIMGDRSELSEDIYKAFQRIGVIHLLAISGLHVGIITGICYYVFLRFGMTHRDIKVVLLFFLPLFALFTGAAPPVVRATVMLMLILISSLIKLNINSLAAVCLSLVLNILYDPRLILSPGFQLSYCVCFALILSSRKLFQGKPYFTVMWRVSVVSTISSLPIILFHFYEVSIIGLITNLVYVPFFSFIILPLCYLTFFISLMIPTLSDRIIYPLEQSIKIMEDMSIMISSIPYSTVLLGKPSIPLLFFCLCLIVSFFYFWEKGKTLYLFILCCTFFFLSFILPFLSPKGEVAFLDVGQGDSIFIKLPFNKGNYLIDTGGMMPYNSSSTYDVGEAIIVPFLKSKGVKRIDKLILTHNDFDHIGGATAVMEEFIVKEIVISPSSLDNVEMNKIASKAASKQIPILQVRAGETWTNSGGSFLVVSPFEEHYEGNNDSLVIYAELGGKRWLFTGDLEEEGERQLLQKWELDIDVLKVGHHGSDTSSTEEFIKSLTPQVSIISAGNNNQFGHPHEAVLSRLQSEKSKVFITAKQGGIHYEYAGNSGTFYTVLP